MSNYTGPISLEAALGGILDNDMNTKPINQDPDIVMSECLDLMAEISTVEQNLTVLEAAKIIKKSKSAKKKVKTKTTKMTAKAAKAKKAGGKVVKIRREDDDIDGGSGPTSTTSDTNGLTDSDLDADPDATVEVTEVDEDGADQEDIIGTEGVDFIVEYEDAAIVQLEAAEAEQKSAFRQKAAELWSKFCDWIMSVAEKIASIFQNNQKFLEKNKAEVAKGLDSDTTVKIKAWKFDLKTVIVGIVDSLKTTKVSDIKNSDFNKAAVFGKLIDNALESKGEVAKFDRKTFIGNYLEDDSGFKEVKMSDTKLKFGDIDTAMKSHKEISKLGSTLRQAANKIKSDKSNSAEELKVIRGNLNKFMQIVSASMQIYNQSFSDVVRVMRAAAKAGGAKDVPADGADK